MEVKGGEKERSWGGGGGGGGVGRKFISPTYGVRIGHHLLYRVFGEVIMDISFRLETKSFWRVSMECGRCCA